MKNLIITLSLLFLIVDANAQLTFEHQYDTGGVLANFIRPVHFSSHGYKYALINANVATGMIEIYNLNHSIYKKFSIPAQPSAGIFGNLNVFYLSDSLFNTNPANFEYAIDYRDTNSLWHTRVYDDSGNVIFSRDSAYFSWVTVTFPYTEPVFYTSSGYKLILNNNNAQHAYVYALPGALPCSECSNSNIISAIGGGPSSGSGNNSGYLQNPYPNPTSHSTTIKYNLPDGVNEGQIVFYDLQGKELKNFNVDRTFDSLNVSTTDLSSGTYFYVLRTTNGIVGNKKVVVIR